MIDNRRDIVAALQRKGATKRPTLDRDVEHYQKRRRQLESEHYYDD